MFFYDSVKAGWGRKEGPGRRGYRICALTMLLLFVLPVRLLASPDVLGYGVKGCDAYNAAFEGWEAGQAEAITEYLHYQDWLAGLVTGLSLATGTDVLRGVEVKGAMRRIQVYCDEHPTEDFFVASMDLVRALSGLR